MKRIAGILLILTLGMMLLAGCASNPNTFEKVEIEDFVTLGNYKGLPYKMSDTAVTDYDIELELRERLKNNGFEATVSEKEITEGVVGVGDTVTMDYCGKKDGVAFEGGTAKEAALTIGSGQFIAGFEEGMAGMKIGETRNLELTFPQDYGVEELNGADVVFEVTVHAVTKRETYPALSDKIVSELNEETKTVKEYMALLKKEVQAQKETNAKTTQRSTLWSIAISNMKFADKLPAKLTAKIEKEFTDYYAMLADQSGYESLESWMNANNVSMKDFESRAAAYAENMVKSQLAAYAIAHAEGYAVTDEVFEKKSVEYATSNGYGDVDKYIKAVGKAAVRDQIILDFAIDLVVKESKVK